MDGRGCIILYNYYLSPVVTQEGLLECAIRRREIVKEERGSGPPEASGCWGVDENRARFIIDRSGNVRYRWVAPDPSYRSCNYELIRIVQSPAV